MKLSGAKQIVAEATQGVELVTRAAHALHTIASASGGEGAAAIIAPALNAAVGAAEEGARMIVGIAQALLAVDEKRESVVDVNTYVMWCAVATTIGGMMPNAAASGLIESADRFSSLSEDKQAVAAARDYAIQGGTLLAHSAMGLSAIIVALTDPNSDRNRRAYTQ